MFALLGKRKVRLYLTGPEMSGKDGVFKKDEGGGVQEEQRAEGQEEKKSVRKQKYKIKVLCHVSLCRCRASSKHRGGRVLLFLCLVADN